MARSLDQQAQELYSSLLRLVRQYQFRDRDEIACHGISVSQCYALAHVRDAGSSTMGDLATALYLDLSTVTRLVDQLEAKAFVSRARADADRRVVLLRLTRKGAGLLAKIEGELVAEYRAVLQDIPVQGRESVLNAIAALGQAFEARSSKDESC